ncbi:MAG: YgfZ/GcvT domain-containing protein [Tepidisphaerales bacterium]
MSTASPTDTPAGPPSPLLEVHRALGGELIDYGGIETVHAYDAPQAEYAAIHKACGLMDRPFRGVLAVGGNDRHSFLNNFLTNQTYSKETKRGLSAGQGVYAFLLNVKGRIVADLNVLETGDEVLLETDRRLLPLVRPALEKFVFTERVTFHDRSGEWSELGLYGPAALSVLQEAGSVAAELSELGIRRVSLFGHEGWLFRDDLCGKAGYHLLLPRASLLEVWEKLNAPYRDQANKRLLRPVGWAMFNACRIEAGRPLFGIDFTDQSLPAETGLFERAVSVTKGCYLGQEIVARMYARGQVARKVVGLRIADDALPAAGAEVTDESGENIVGAVTSSTLSPVLGGAAIALAVIKKGYFDPGTRLRVPAEGAHHIAHVTALPFIR